ncbi:hypothetical protein FOVSG1_000124 [Fusarium oxysporum f. sp. vasinfectum]
MVDGDVRTTVGEVNAQRISHPSYVHQLTDLHKLAERDKEDVRWLNLVLVTRLGPEGGNWGAASTTGGSGDTNEEVIYIPTHLECKIVAGVDFKGIHESRLCWSSAKRRRLRTEVHCLSLNDLDSTTIHGATPLGADDAIVSLPHLELGSRAIGTKHLSTHCSWRRP